MHRREFLKTSAASAAVALTGLPTLAGGENETAKLARKLPRWRGFNLFEKLAEPPAPFVESDLHWMAEWGFDFVRLPLDYRCWTDPNDPYKFKEAIFAEIDRTVELGRKLGIHVCLDLHRVPGYTVAQPAEKLDLWTSEEAQKLFCFQWSHFARRYRGIPSRQLSFNLLNEPAKTTAEAYAKVARRAVAAIRARGPRTVDYFGRASLGARPGVRVGRPGHCPKRSLLRSDAGQPLWGHLGRQQGLAKAHLAVERRRHGLRPSMAVPRVHRAVEETGIPGRGRSRRRICAYNKTPHDVVLGWIRDLLGLWKEAGWGWAMWNFRGGIGILDSGREDVAYEDFRGHKLDRKLLTLLQQF